MKRNFLKYFLVLTLFFAVPANFLYAGVSDNIGSGGTEAWGWSSNYGWISFNCTNETTCGTNNYGVNVDTTTGKFSGYAWSGNAGWISFSEGANVPDSNYSSHCKVGANCTQASNCTACYDPGTSRIYGWAKALQFGEDGWIKFDYTPAPGDVLGGVYVATSTIVGSYQKGDLYGYAWSGTDSGKGLGWINFNCFDRGREVCEYDYRVRLPNVDILPYVTNATSSLYSFTQVCNNDYSFKDAKLGWTFNGDAGATQEAYEVSVFSDVGMTNMILDTGICDGSPDASTCRVNPSGNNYEFSLRFADAEPDLAANTAYYWKVQVWDNKDLASATSTGPSFTTYKNSFPETNFTWAPLQPVVGDKITFTDSTTFYDGHGAVDHSWYWTFPSDIANPEHSALSEQEVAFSSSGTYNNINVILKATDFNGYYCETTKQVESITMCLPNWREINP